VIAITLPILEVLNEESLTAFSVCLLTIALFRCASEKKTGQIIDVLFVFGKSVYMLM